MCCVPITEQDCSEPRLVLPVKASQAAWLKLGVS